MAAVFWQRGMSLVAFLHQQAANMWQNQANRTDTNRRLSAKGLAGAMDLDDHDLEALVPGRPAYQAHHFRQEPISSLESIQVNES